MYRNVFTLWVNASEMSISFVKTTSELIFEFSGFKRHRTRLHVYSREKIKIFKYLKIFEFWFLFFELGHGLERA